MKQIILKTTILALYLSTVQTLIASPDLFSAGTLWIVELVLAYCGIIILAHLVSTLVAWLRWCVAARRDETLAVPSVIFDTETEAT